MSRTSFGVIVLLAIAGIAGYYWWQLQTSAPLRAPLNETAVPPEATPPAPEPAVRHPIESVAPETGPTTSAPAPELAGATLDAALIDLLGRDAVASFLRMTDLPRRVAATVDGLAHTQAPPAAWPVQPTAGRFTVETRQGTSVLSDGNTARYAPFVKLVESADTGRALAIYVRFYPMFQEAYESLGYPGRYFNDRLVAVVDNLLATPEPAGPIALTLTEVRSDTPPARPWVHYRFADPALEGLSAGQKMLIRVGPEHRARLKAKLTQIRRQLAGAAPPAR